MVSVRLSSDIIRDMKDAALEKFLLSDPKPTNKVELTDKILEGIRELPAYKAAVEFTHNPAITAFKGNNYASSIHSYINEFTKTGLVKTLQIHGLKDPAGKDFTFTSDLKVPATMHFADAYRNSLTLHISQFNEPYKQEIIDGVATGMAEIHAWEERKKEYQTKTGELFDACKSTKQLLDAWPAAEAFLPKQIVDKMQTKQVNAADLEAKAKREAFSSEGLDKHILVANIITQVNNGGDNT